MEKVYFVEAGNFLENLRNIRESRKFIKILKLSINQGTRRKAVDFYSKVDGRLVGGRLGLLEGHFLRMSQ